MGISEPEFTLGIEEEYLLVDRDSRDLAGDHCGAIIEACTARCEGQVGPELLKPQIEVGTRVCHSIAEARENLAHLRATVAACAAEYGLAPIAASTHPFATWSAQAHTERERYHALTREMQAAARRLLICGMHVHVGIGDDELRIDLMNQLSYFLPHLLAMSCSSPFWQGRETGLKSYRLTVFDALPRTGIPERFNSHAEYRRHVGILVDAGIIEDASRIWWDLRPSSRYPTLETRVMDVCTTLDDTLALAALNLCILRMLYRLRRRNQRWRIYTPMLLRENRWRAMRYSFEEGMIDLALGRVVPFADLLEELLELTAEDAEALDCQPQMQQLREILARGTSAHRQESVFRSRVAAGDTPEEAHRHVVDFLIEETVRGVST
ncbi:MAG: carboxylate-amine ligase [Gammaproteobacteria bacterium]|nr:MAG: carboxylate-amine ligase [Gammaproteobacteria bacterium]